MLSLALVILGALFIIPVTLITFTGKNPQRAGSNKDQTENKTENPLTNLIKFFEFAILFIFSTIGLSYLSAAILGFPGIWGPINALEDTDVGYLVTTFVIMLLAVIWISVKHGASWKTVKNIWLIPGCAITAIYAILLGFYPGLDDALAYHKINKVQQTGLYAKVSKGTKAYIEDDKGFFIPNKKHLDKDIYYPIIHGKGFKKDGNYELIAIMLPDKNGEFTKKATIGWIRTDEGGADKGIKIISRADLYTKIDDSKFGPPPPNFKIYPPGTYTFSLKAGEKTDHWIMFPAGRNNKYYLSSTDYNYKLIYNDGDVIKDGKNVHYPQKSRAKFKIIANTNQPKIKLVVR